MGREYIPLAPRRVPTYPPTHPPRGVCGDVGVWELLQQRRDQLSEAVPGPVEPALHGAEVAGGDLGDLRITLALELAQHEPHPVMLGQLAHALIHRVLQEPLAVEIVGPRGRVLELERPVVGLPVLLDRLEQHERVAAAVAQLVLGQVRGDRIDPGGELLRLVEAVQMPEYADEHLLHQILGPLPVPDRAVDEIEQSGLVAVDERAEGLPIARQVLEHQPAVVQLVERLALPGAWGAGGWGLLFEGCSHDTGSVVSARNVPDLREDGSIVLEYGTNRTRSDVTPSSLRTARRSGPASAGRRSEERRVGKECRSRWSPYH